MAIYVSSSPDAQVIGEILLGILDGMGAFKKLAEISLKKNGIENPIADQWYSYQGLLNTLQMIEEKTALSTMNTLGKKMLMYMQLPPRMGTLEAVLNSFNEIYFMNHRGIAPTEGWKCTKAGERSARLLSSTPYPTEFEQGMLRGFVDKMVARGAVEIEKSSTKRDGGHFDSFLVSW